ncbi:transglycosylase family protein [Kitasatospora sp. NPDC088346]|uniref:transglycosylase family protein n=1 Tax=Kitasatospora sp. NPDC088346 TaxID=3364073 RepID=UPI00381B398B
MLFTGTGRHRRRTQAEKVIAAAGVAGVGLALPLLTAGGAHAAPVSTWDRVAQCESGGNWGINTGNGFYGGLQFTPSTWKSFGGTQYAAQANQASKGQQIAVAERVLASQGPGAWPVCSVRAGLTKGGAAAQVDTDDADGDSARGSTPAKSGRKPSTPKATRPAAPREAVPQAAAVEQDDSAEESGDTYTVHPGDTLSAIADARRLAGGWQRLYQANQAVIGADPDLIEPGQVLRLG